VGEQGGRRDSDESQSDEGLSPAEAARAAMGVHDPTGCQVTILALVVSGVVAVSGLIRRLLRNGWRRLRKAR